MTDQPSRFDRIEATQAMHSQILSQLALANQQLTDFATRQAERQEQRTTTLEQSMQALSQTQAETLRLIADNSRAIAQCEIRIQEILERLDQRFNNGNGRSNGN